MTKFPFWRPCFRGTRGQGWVAIDKVIALFRADLVTEEGRRKLHAELRLKNGTEEDLRRARSLVAQVETALSFDDAESWARVREAHGLVYDEDTKGARRAKALNMVEDTIAKLELQKGDELREVRSLLLGLRRLDERFRDLRPESAAKAFRGARSAAKVTKGGKGNRGAFRVAAELAAAVGAFGETDDVKAATAHFREAVKGSGAAKG